MDKRIELLVHAGAPSSRKADNGYVSQAAHYLGIQPSRIVRTKLVEELDDRSRDISAHHNDLTRINESIIPNDPTTYLDSTQSAYDCLESQLISNSLDYAAVEATVGLGNDITVARQSHSPKTQSQSDSESESSQTSYLKTPKASERFLYIEQDTNPPLVERSIRNHGTGSTDSASVVEHGPPIDGPSAMLVQSAEDDNDDISELPTSYGLSDSANTGSKTGLEIQTRPPIAQSNPTTDVMYQPEQTLDHVDEGLHSSPEQQIDIALEKSPSILRTNPPLYSNTQPQSRCSAEKPNSNIIPAKPFQQPQPQKLFQRDRDVAPQLARLPRTIYSPMPEVSIHSFTTHVTPSLKHLEEKVEFEKHYIPISVTRQISPLERGHWLVPCASWPVQQQLDLWQFLHDFLGGGGAGWGVWCTIEESSLSEDGADEAEAGNNGDSRMEETDPDGGGFGPVKVYCWGEVVGHVYVLLYLASRARVRKAGLRWVDAEGITVVRMRGD